MSASEIVEEVRDGRLTAVAAMERCLTRIADFDRDLEARVEGALGIEASPPVG